MQYIELLEIVAYGILGFILLVWFKEFIIYDLKQTIENNNGVINSLEKTIERIKKENESAHEKIYKDMNSLGDEFENNLGVIESDFLKMKKKTNKKNKLETNEYKIQELVRKIKAYFEFMDNCEHFHYYKKYGLSLDEQSVPHLTSVFHIPIGAELNHNNTWSIQSRITLNHFMDNKIMLKYFENESKHGSYNHKEWCYINIGIMLNDEHIKSNRNTIQQKKNEYVLERPEQQNTSTKQYKINNLMKYARNTLNDYDVYKFEETEEEYEIRFLTMILQRFENVYENYQKFKYILGE
jgi:hypothetical protein